MKIKILNWNSPCNKPGQWMPAKQFWLSPDGKYAIAEIFAGELFVAGKVVRNTLDQCTMTFFSEIQNHSVEVSGHQYETDWHCMIYGFCKLICRDMESPEPIVHRIYFDKKLYLKKRQELHGTDKKA